MPIAIKKILKLIEWSLFLLVLLVLFVVASPLLPTEKYASTYVVATGSMEPEIMTGSLVLVTPSQSYGEGDVVVFTSPKDSTKTIVHRVDEEINSSSGTTFVTKGDNNDSTDPWTINNSDIQGDVKFIVPYVGSTIEWIKTPIGFGIFMLIPALIFGILQFLKINEGINEEVEKRVEEKMNKTGIAMGTMKRITTLIIIATSILAITATPKIYALFSDTVSVSNLKIEIADFDETDPEFGFEGGLSVFDKTTNSSLNVDEFNAKSRTNVNVVFRPAQLPTNAHHFTIIMQDMSDNHMVHYRTMLSRWTMENYTLDGHLGYTVWYEGSYWLQVNSYDMAGNPVGEFFAVLNISNIDASELHEGLEPEIDQTETEEDVETPIVEEPEVDDEIVDETEAPSEEENPSDEEINEETPPSETEPPVESGKDTVEQIEP